MCTTENIQECGFSDIRKRIADSGLLLENHGSIFSHTLRSDIQDMKY